MRALVMLVVLSGCCSVSTVPRQLIETRHPNITAEMPFFEITKQLAITVDQLNGDKKKLSSIIRGGSCLVEGEIYD